MYENLGRIEFPKYTGISVNMMPIVAGDIASVPEDLRGYFGMIEQCALPQGDIVYLTVTESLVQQGQTQRRGGLHTEGFVTSGPLGSKFGGGTPPGSWGASDSVKRDVAYDFGGSKFGARKLGSWGAAVAGERGGLFMSSTDGACSIYNTQTWDVNAHGGLLTKPEVAEEFMNPNELYWLTDRTPHEALPVKVTGPRQFFRLVSKYVSVWYSKHNTPNPLGIQPGASIVEHSKFV